MSLLGRGRNWLRGIVDRRRRERDMQQEMQAHLDQAAERLMARGMSEDAARLAARREFGNPAVVQEQARDARGGRWVDDLAGDVRYALRYFARTPLLSLTIVLTLMLGIGTNSAMLAILDGLTNRPAPGVPRDPSLVFLTGTVRFGERQRLIERNPSFREISDYRALPIFRDVAAFVGGGSVVYSTGPDDASLGTATVDYVTPNYFDVAGIPLALGSGFIHRTFGGLDEPELTAIIGYSLWKGKFASAPDIVGRQIRVNDRQVTIVGVAPPRFNGVLRSNWQRKLWMPASAMPLIDGTTIDVTRYDRGNHFTAFARLAPGVTRASAQPAVSVVAANAAAQIPPDRSRRDFRTEVRAIWNDLGNSLGTPDMLIGSAIVGAIGLLILLICCTNVSSLLVGAAARRRYEIAVRLSMGAPRGRIVRQLLTEISLLCLAGAALGLGLYALVVLKVSQFLLEVDIAPDWSSALGAVVVALTTAFICGLSPALHATRVELSSVLKSAAGTTTTRSRLQRTFVIAQVALTQPLLVGLGVMVVVLYSEMNFRSRSAAGDHVLRAYYTSAVQARDAGARGEQQRALRERIAALPGVAGVVSGGFGVMQATLTLDDVPTTKPFKAYLEGVNPGYFKALDLPVIRGREFVPEDLKAAQTPVLVESEVAAILWGEADPLGKRLKIAPSGQARGALSSYVVVGVVDTRHSARPMPFTSVDAVPLFVPNTTSIGGPIIVRTRGPAAPYVGSLRAIGMASTPQLVLTEAKTLSEIEGERIRDRLTAIGLAAGGGVLALFLGAIGLHAVVSLGVAQRTREIGIRISVGATPVDVVHMFFAAGVRLGATGLAIGLPLSLGALWLNAGAFEVRRASIPIVAGSVMVSVLVVTALASWLPARRAAMVDPLTALRTE